jgi:hypothetical protein
LPASDLFDLDDALELSVSRFWVWRLRSHDVRKKALRLREQYEFKESGSEQHRLIDVEGRGREKHELQDGATTDALGTDRVVLLGCDGAGATAIKCFAMPRLGQTVLEIGEYAVTAGNGDNTDIENQKGNSQSVEKAIQLRKPA